ncbi:hypothetical protein KY46_13800 [Photobacterium halotolerans]|uniref:Uncharacterized protein n=2 Tax=Photobacterium halotolerans TaxID=265726 RepID=A0A0F5VAN0_9GAMM|nr:hypothetical protein KY46_13800 [Photobacterium halotolerans]
MTMKITVPATAANSGILRVWLRRIPADSQIIYAFRTSPDAMNNYPVSQAPIYGRGQDSPAIEKVMLQFQVNSEEQPFRAGEVLILKKLKSSYDASANPPLNAYEDIEFDVIEIT